MIIVFVKEDYLFLLQEKFVKLKEDGPTVVQLMAPSFQVCLLIEKSN